MTSLSQLLQHQPKPLALSEYIDLCLNHPQWGYYRQRSAVGRTGDFVTAPEVSQLFGEMVGLWCVEQWQRLGQPERLNLVEFGPGRGTLMADLLRVCQKVHPLAAGLAVHLVEVNPLLIYQQQQTLADYPSVRWWSDYQLALNQLTEPTLVIANEFLDVFPVDQYLYQDGNWYYKAIDAQLQQCVLPCSELPPAVVLEQYYRLKDLTTVGGPIQIEYTPGMYQVAAAIATTLARVSGAAVMIDYGYDNDQVPIIDTVQGVRAHQYHDIFSCPGEIDITAHVNFAALSRWLQHYHQAIKVLPILTQQQFLRNLGIELRLAQLQRHNPTCDHLSLDYRRLMVDMGELFKVIIIENFS